MEVAASLKYPCRERHGRVTACAPLLTPSNPLVVLQIIQMHLEAEQGDHISQLSGTWERLKRVEGGSGNILNKDQKDRF